MKKIVIYGIEYRPVEKSGNRALIVVDRGWIFAGDVTEENGRIKLSRAVWVFRWTGGQGISGVINDPCTDCDIRPIDDVDIPKESEIYRIAVAKNWGLK